MDEHTPQPEPEKQRFLLPDGCKDLIDALRPQQQRAEEEELRGSGVSSAHATPPELPASIALPDPVIVRDLASALHLKPFQIIGSLMQLNVFVSLNSSLDFPTASRLCSHYGVAATKVA